MARSASTRSASATRNTASERRSAPKTSKIFARVQPSIREPLLAVVMPRRVSCGGGGEAFPLPRPSQASCYERLLAESSARDERQDTGPRYDEQDCRRQKRAPASVGQLLGRTGRGGASRRPAARRSASRSARGARRRSARRSARGGRR